MSGGVFILGFISFILWYVLAEIKDAKKNAGLFPTDKDGVLIKPERKDDDETA